MQFHDSLGNPVTLDDAGALAGLDDFVMGLISSEARAVNILATAEHDASPLVQGYAAAVHMFAESVSGPANARPYLARARAGASRASEREQRFIEAVGAWVEGDMDKAVRLHEEQAALHPRDLASVKLGQYHRFNRGDAPGMLRIGLAALPAAGDVAYLHGMLAFALEQCHLLDQAEQAALRAIAMRRKEPWAHHAVAHVMITQGRISEGHAFLTEYSPTWTGLNSFMVTHNWWHLALFALEFQRHDEVLSLYDRQVWGVVPEYTQDQVNAVSLLARLELAGVDVGSRWQAVAPYLAARVDDHFLPFLDMHYLYGLARADRPEADALMRSLERDAARREGADAAAWQEVCVPACRGLLAHARGDAAGAVAPLGQALQRMVEIGGSHAQRDLFAQIHLDALVRTGRLREAQALLQVQLNGQPESLRLRQQADGVYAALGLGSVLRCRF